MEVGLISLYERPIPNLTLELLSLSGLKLVILHDIDITSKIEIVSKSYAKYLVQSSFFKNESDLLEEYEKIELKKSRLSRQKRDQEIYRFKKIYREIPNHIFWSRELLKLN